MSQNKRFQDDLKLIEELDNEVEELYITSKFPPLTDVSGIVFSKRIMVANRKVDVLCSNFKGDVDNDFNTLISNFIKDKIIVEGDFAANTIPGINYFRQEGMKKINVLGKDYKTIISRAWTLESHFLALDYKLQNPDVVWIAEFSDPLALNMDRRFRSNHPYPLDDEFLLQINELISKINEEEFGDDVDRYFPEVKSEDQLYFLVEYLPYLIADVVRFTNTNQREIMMDLFPVDMKDFVFRKSEVITHPVLDSEFYFLKKSSYEVDSNYLNFAYFGTYIGKRHLEYIFKSLEELNDEIKEKIRLHMFVPNPDVLNLNLKDLSIFDNIQIGDKLPFLEFLNLTTNVDVLIVNDSITKGTFDINPYLPSKVADYLGSGNDIWYLCEDTSYMNSYDAKYKSYINDYESARSALEKIIHDKLGFEDVFDEVLDSEYYQNRLTNLNNVIHDIYGQRVYWVNQTHLLMDKNNRLNSNIRKLNHLGAENKSLVKQINDKNERIGSLREDCDLLIDDIHVKDDEINALKIELASKDEDISYLEREYNALRSDVQDKERIIVELSNEVEDFKKEVSSFKDKSKSDNLQKSKLKKDYDKLHKLVKESFDLVEIREDRISSLEMDNTALHEDIRVRDDMISSLESKYGNLNEKIGDKDELISNLSNEVDDLKKEVSSFKNQLESDYLEKTRLKEDYDDLNKLADEAFDMIQIKESIIQDKADELEYYRNNGNLFNRLVSNPLSNIYLLVTSSGKEREINKRLFEFLKATDWFNVVFYINENDDISKFKWLKLFSPQLHYVCHGFDEKRNPNRDGEVPLSKQELLDKLLSQYDEK